MRSSFPCFLIFVFLLPSCASTRNNPLLSQDPDTEINKKDFQALLRKANTLWPNRNTQEALTEFIQTEEQIAKTKLATPEDLVLLSRAYYLKAEYFTDNTHVQSKLWESGANWAEKALTFNEKFKKKVAIEKIPTDQALDVLTKKESEALYWVAVNVGRWATLEGLKTVLRYKDKIKKMIDRVAALNPHYHYGAVFRYNGVYFASLPGFNEEDLKNSKNNFEMALKRAPEYFANHVLFSECYAKKVDDMILYKRHLEFAANGNTRSLKDSVPEQILEQIKAKKLLEGLKK